MTNTPNSNSSVPVRLRPEMTIEALRSLISQDMSEVNQLIQQNLQSEVALINQLGHYIINSGGKRLRPSLHLLCARVFAYNGQQHIKLAAILEFIHTATLLHDDVVDSSKLRRGRETANQLWGNEASVLVGDFLYSRAFQMMVEVNSMRVMEILSETTNTIAEGEVLQLLNTHDPDTTEASYLEVIQNKTAKLFIAASQLAAVIAERSEEEERAMANYGMHLGTAFQLVDDCLDYTAESSQQLGKNIGDDLSEGRTTLPLLYAMWHGDDHQSKVIRAAIAYGGLENIATIQKAIEQTGAIDYSLSLARKAAESAINELSPFEDSPYVEALRSLARYAIERDH